MTSLTLRQALVAAMFTAPMAVPAFAATSSVGLTHSAVVAPAAIDDGQIAQFISIANQSEIDASSLAVTKAENTDVTAFAKEMVKAHTAAGKDADALFSQLGLHLSDSTDTEALRADVASGMTELRLLQGAAFDREYINRQVNAHQQLLTAIDTKLLDQAQNAELKNFITKLRPTVAMHLQHARQIASALQQ